MTKRFLKLAISALLFITTNISFACEHHCDEQTNTCIDLKTDLTKNIKEYRATHTLNAIYSISQDNQTLIKGASGYFDYEAKKPLVPNSRMAIASGTKQMTAAVVLRLQEQGKLNVNDPVSKYLTQESVYFGGKLPEWADKVTLHHLLTHTSGLPDYIFGMKLDMTKTHKEINHSIAEFAAKQTLNFTPGQQFQYSNTGYVLLGLIIEQLAGKDLRVVFKEELFEPLGMKNTELATLKQAIDFQQGKAKAFPKRYFVVPTGGKPQFNLAGYDMMLSPFSDGGVVSTLDDLNKWNHGLHNGKVLTAESYKLMTNGYAEVPAPEGFKSKAGYGIYAVQPPVGDSFYIHGGHAIAIRGEYIYVPAKKLAINIISNTDVYVPEPLKGKIDYTTSANQIDIKYFKDMILQTVLK
jgi:D-alanyl-D-alanine carboxypeptidase